MLTRPFTRKSVEEVLKLQEKFTFHVDLFFLVTCCFPNNNFARIVNCQGHNFLISIWLFPNLYIHTFRLYLPLTLPLALPLTFATFRISIMSRLAVTFAPSSTFAPAYSRPFVNTSSYSNPAIVENFNSHHDVFSRRSVLRRI